MGASAEPQRGQELHLCIGDVLEHQGLSEFQGDEVLFGSWDGHTGKHVFWSNLLESQSRC